jgi:hypothetical protein
LVWLFNCDFNVTHFKILNVVKEESGRREGAKHGRLWIHPFGFWYVELRTRIVGSTDLMEIDIADLDVLDRVARYVTEYGRKLAAP